ncbi:protein TIC 55, chloroplastic [Magnolia sinica]|uniref:protein TIC 55, chloroplastic n=1 Tax=Magnolia sinica TaxID=86752 RepID=UPI0026591DF8|nr:protein TIC 55, chloroplastic [Magnolia sinica]
MTLLLLPQPFLRDLSFKNSLLSLFSQKPTSISSPSLSNTLIQRPTALSITQIEKPRKGFPKHCSATAEIERDISTVGNEEGEVQVPVEEETRGEDAVVKYDWKEEWYPLYLTEQIPDDAPLGLTVFDKQIVLYRDGNGVLRCHEDRCPHRLAKLSEGQLIDGRLECLYHGWQFEGDGKCVKIPQLPAGAKIPNSACVKTYEVRDSQGVVWVWMSDRKTANADKLPWFEHYARPGFQDLSTIHELPYDHSILLENLMDPAHVPISHDRTDWSAKREDAQALSFKVTERTNRGFAGHWGKASDGQSLPNFLRFEAPCVLQNNRVIVDKNGEQQYFSALFLCRPAGQGKSMLIVRFGASIRSFLVKLLPKWYFHQNAGKVFEQDMGFLSSQNEVLMKENVPTKDLYLNIQSSDTWVAEYRKWMDKVGHGMPYYFGHKTISLPKVPAVVEHAPAGLVAGISASMPAKGGIGTVHAPNPANRYFRHVVHCKGCRDDVQAFQAWKNALYIMTFASAALAVVVSGRQWKVLFLVSAALFLTGMHACSSAVSLITTNFVRKHRRL